MAGSDTLPGKVEFFSIKIKRYEKDDSLSGITSDDRKYLWTG
jgi:hypothetical protein